MPYRAEDPFAAIADPQRRRMIELLSREPMTISGLAEHFEMSPQGVAKHLGVLKKAGVVDAEAQGRASLHRLRPEGLAPIADWLAIYDQFWSARLARLKAKIEQEGEDL